MSKLPKMSQSPAPPPVEQTTPDPQATEPVPTDYRTAADNSGAPMADAWISIAIGLIVIFMNFRPIEYVISNRDAFAQKYQFWDASRAPITYTQSVFFWGDVALLTFGLVLVGEGLLRFTRRASLTMVALVFTLLAVLLNLAFVAGMMAGGYGLQLWSAVAVAFGVYIAIYQWKRMQMLRLMPSPRR